MNAEDPFDVVLNDAFVFDGEEPLADPKSIGVRGGRIAAISDNPLRGREILNARGRWVAPGLVESPIHLVPGSDSFAPTITVPGVVTGMFGANSIVEAERMVEAGVGPIEVLRSATSRAAVHLERKDIGVVAVGACADLVMFQADPTQSIANWKDPLAVIAQGRVVVNADRAAH